MCRKLYIKIVVLAFLFIAPAVGSSPQKLHLLQATPIDSREDLEPSALAVCEGRLLILSDKHDNKIYQITDTLTPTASVYRTLDNIPPPPQSSIPLWHVLQRWLGALRGSTYDWEGMACDKAGNLYLASESYAAILHVPPTGRPVWLNIPIDPYARRAGFFKHYNAYIEGVAWDEQRRRLIIAAEREPRGLLSATKDKDHWLITSASLIASSLITPPHKRPDDFSDVLFQNNALYTLERNISSVCRRDPGSFELQRCWSYAHVENSRQYRYTDTRYGLAEGLAVLDGKLLIMFDNNGKMRASHADARPLLLIFNLPADWVALHPH